MRFGSFKNKNLEQFVLNGKTKGIRQDLIPNLAHLLTVMRFTGKPEGFDPKWRCHFLCQSGRYSLTVKGAWRLTFAFSGEEAVAIDLEQYHRSFFFPRKREDSGVFKTKASESFLFIGKVST